MWKNQRVQMNILRVTFGETQMEGVTISGPTTSSVIEVFIALYDLAGATGIEGVGLPEKVDGE